VDVVQINAAAPSFGYGAWMNLLERGAEAIVAELPNDVGRRTVFAQSTPGALLQAADAEGADAIVVGSAHMGCIGRVLAGSVGAALARRAACPLIVAPFGYRLRDDAPAPGQKIESAVPAR
jgi:nucleotide-binding universal stress UspA family protein